MTLDGGIEIDDNISISTCTVSQHVRNLEDGISEDGELTQVQP